MQSCLENFVERRWRIAKVEKPAEEAGFCLGADQAEHAVCDSDTEKRAHHAIHVSSPCWYEGGCCTAT